MKTCSKCQIVKEECEFYKNQRWCITCKKQYNQENSIQISIRGKQYCQDHREELKTYRQKNSEKIKDYQKRWYQENKEELNARSAAYYQTNKEKITVRFVQYNLNNKETIRLRAAKYYQDNKEKLNAINKIYIEKNKEKVSEYQRNYQRERQKQRREIPGYKLSSNMSRLIRRAIKLEGSSKGRESSFKYLEYTREEYRTHIESQFEPWMNWGNYGAHRKGNLPNYRWQIDHIIPQSDLPYSSMEDENFKKCWALSNLRPLCAKRNQLEGVQRTRHAKKNDAK